MRLSVAQRFLSGIAAALPARVTWVADDELSPSDALALRRLVEAADFFGLPARIGSVGGGSDADYAFTIEDAGAQHTVAVTSDEMPPELAALLAWVRMVPERHEETTDL